MTRLNVLCDSCLSYLLPDGKLNIITIYGNHSIRIACLSDDNLDVLSLFLLFGVSSQAEDEEEEDQPLSLSWPDSNRKRLTYLLIIPIVLPLWLTLPDVRKTVRAQNVCNMSSVLSGWSPHSTRCSLVFLQSSQKFFPITFLGAICWIACFSYLMVWWAHQVRSPSETPLDVTLFKK